MKKQRSVAANYFSRLKEVLKAQTISYFLLLSFSSLFMFKMALSAFFAREGIGVDWITYTLIVLFVFSFIFQTLILQKKCYPLFLFRVLIVMFIGGQVGERFFKKTNSEFK